MGKVCNNCRGINGAVSAREYKKIRTLTLALIAVAVAFVATNAVWLYAWCFHLL